MAVYIILLLLVFLCGYILYRYPNGRNAKKIYLIVTFSSMAIILGLRGEKVGEDTEHYLTMFKGAAQVKWITMLRSKGFRTTWYVDPYGFHDTVENGWLTLCKIVHIFTDNGQVFLFIVALLTCGLFAKFIYDNSESILYSTLIYLCESMYMFSFNEARQMLAVSVTLQVYTALKHRKVKTAVLLVLLASLIHNTALVTFIMFPIVLTKQRKSYKKFKYAVVIAIAAPFLVMSLRGIISKLVPRYASYFGTNYWKNSIGGSAVLWILEILLIAVMYLKEFEYPQSYQYACFVLLYLSCALMGLQVTMFARIGYYFRAFLPLFFPSAVNFFKKKDRLMVNFIVIAFIILLYFSYAHSDTRMYSFFWNNGR